MLKVCPKTAHKKANLRTKVVTCLYNLEFCVCVNNHVIIKLHIPAIPRGERLQIIKEVHQNLIEREPDDQHDAGVVDVQLILYQPPAVLQQQ